MSFVRSTGQAINVTKSGSNENGNYIKFDDGTMICTKTINANLTANSTWGALFESESVSLGNSPQNFIDTPKLFLNPSGRYCIIEAPQGTTPTSFGNTWVARPVKDTIANLYIINILAIGKWK